MASAIRAISIGKSFGKLSALRNVSFCSADGLNLILGPNGAGKSTLLRCIDGLYRVESGSVRVLGEDPYTSSDVKSRMSLLTDNYALYDFLTVEGNLKFFGRLYGLKDREILSRSRIILGRLDAMQYMNRKVNELSRGTKQKIAFCRAVLNDPRVLLLDEPTAFLDAHSAEAMRQMILEYEREGRTILFVTQKLDEVTRFNGKISIIKAGRIVKETTTEGLYKMALRGTEIDVRIASPLSPSSTKRIKGLTWTNSDRPTVLRFRVNGYREINRIVKSLMDCGASIVSVDYVEHLIDDLSR